MIITIFGATGIVGRQLVKHALLHKYTVRAFGRNIYTAEFSEHENLELIAGAVFDAGQVQAALKGADAVLSALGGAENMVDKTRSLGMKQIVAGMESQGLKRIVAVGNFGLLDNESDELFMQSPNYPTGLLAVAKEHYKAYEYLKNSALNWTVVCPRDIVPAEATYTMNVAPGQQPSPGNGKINSGDLAAFMVDELTKNEYPKMRVGISN